MDGSRLAKTRVSCLKIEPKVSIFPVIEANLASITCATTGNFSSSLFLYFWMSLTLRSVEDFYVSSLDASSFAKRISWLKFEPKVSNFPVIEANLTSITLAITRSLFFVLFFYTFLVSLTYKVLETFIVVGFLSLCGLLRHRSWRFGWRILILNR